MSTFYLTVIVNAIIFINKFCFKPTEFIYHLLSESLGNIDNMYLRLQSTWVLYRVRNPAAVDMNEKVTSLTLRNE